MFDFKHTEVQEQRSNMGDEFSIFPLLGMLSLGMARPQDTIVKGSC